MSKREPGQRFGWIALTMLLAMVGMLGSLAGAITVAHDDHGRETQAFVASANDVVSTLRLALQHEQDLSINAAAFLASHPQPSNLEFRSWADSIQAVQRYPELAEMGLVELVPAAGVPAYVARMEADPRHPTEAGKLVTIMPPGKRAYYCLPTVSVGPGDSSKAGLDFCAVGISHLATRDSGVTTVDSFPVGDKTWLGMGTPVYSTGTTPATVAERQAKFVGWLGSSLMPDVVLERALSAHPDLAVRYEYQHRATASFSSGKIVSGARSVTLDVGSGWSATIYGPSAENGLLHNGRALTVLLAGLAVSLLVAALVFVLATGRTRARRMVAMRTQQLHYQASHDALTGLPNRARILELMEQSFEKANGQDAAMAVLFIDLDGFKSVNDTLGHDAGDQLLKEVAVRLDKTLRGADTVGRLGGDEFVAVVDGGQREAEAAAQRIREVLSDPVFLTVGDKETAVTIASSVGIAAGMRADAGELLRDADTALYQAKNSGKNRYVVYSGDVVGAE
jgi:diguanylate cyclase (GGDEF)-like protein